MDVMMGTAPRGHGAFTNEGVGQPWNQHAPQFSNRNLTSLGYYLTRHAQITGF